MEQEKKLDEILNILRDDAFGNPGLSRQVRELRISVDEFRELNATRLQEIESRLTYLEAHRIANNAVYALFGGSVGSVLMFLANKLF